MEEGAAIYGDTKYLAQVLRSFGDDFNEQFGFPLDTNDFFSDKSVENYVRNNLDRAELKEVGEKVVLEMAPPCKEQANPGAKLASPMSTYRAYLEEFEASTPYDYDNDKLATTSHADDISTHVGAVVFNKNSVDKPHKPIYKACAHFINKLQGAVLVVGDVNGAVTVKLHKNRNFKVLPFTDGWSSDSYSWLQDCANYMLEWDDLSTTIDNIRFDHVVYLFRGGKDELIDSLVGQDTTHHFLDFIEDKFMVKISKGSFMYKGKNLSTYTPTGSLCVPHTTLFGYSEDSIAFLVLWWTQEKPLTLRASMIPLTPSIGVGEPEDLYCSEKMNGEPVLIVVENGHMVTYKDEKKINDGRWCDKRDQVLMGELIGNKIYILEPLYGDDYYFEDWVLIKKTMKFKSNNYEYNYKPWLAVTEATVKIFLAGNSEGVCFKRRKEVVGKMDPVYRKIATYYVKNPLYASYEDYVFCNGDFVYQGVHNIYTDPSNLYEGEGVYEVSANKPYVLMRKRNKDYGDLAWYVDAVRMPFKYKNFLIRPDKMLFDIKQDGHGGIVHLSRQKITIAKDTQVELDGNNNMIYTSSMHFAKGHKIFARGTEWRVSIKRVHPDIINVYRYYCVKEIIK